MEAILASLFVAPDEKSGYKPKYLAVILKRQFTKRNGTKNISRL